MKQSDGWQSSGCNWIAVSPPWLRRPAEWPVTGKGGRSSFFGCQTRRVKRPSSCSAPLAWSRETNGLSTFESPSRGANCHLCSWIPSLIASLQRTSESTSGSHPEYSGVLFGWRRPKLCTWSSHKAFFLYLSGLSCLRHFWPVCPIARSQGRRAR